MDQMRKNNFSWLTGRVCSLSKTLRWRPCARTRWSNKEQTFPVSCSFTSFVCRAEVEQSSSFLELEKIPYSTCLIQLTIVSNLYVVPGAVFSGQASISISVSNSQIQENVVWLIVNLKQFPSTFKWIIQRGCRWMYEILLSYRILVQCTRFLLMKCWDLGSLE